MSYKDYDAGLFGDWGGGNVEWWHDYLRIEIESANEHWKNQLGIYDHPRVPFARVGDWMQTYTGRQFWPIDPRPEDIDIRDIAHALSMMCRYNGHCRTFYSVGEHSVLVSQHVPPEHALWGLLHDAGEAYIADIVRPAKRFIAGYLPVEEAIMNAVCERFGLLPTMPTEVKRVDNAILADEQRCIMATPPVPWTLLEPALGVDIVGLAPWDAEARFLDRYVEIVDGNG